MLNDLRQSSKQFKPEVTRMLFSTLFSDIIETIKYIGHYQNQTYDTLYNKHPRNIIVHCNVYSLYNMELTLECDTLLYIEDFIKDSYTQPFYSISTGFI